MVPSVVPVEWFRSDARDLAPLMLGMLLCRETPDGVVRARVTETEAYLGESDTACHASHGRTRRSEVLYWSGGRAYVHHCYMFDLLTIVTSVGDDPQGVLVRGVEGSDGPGRVSVAMGIDKGLHGLELVPGNGIWFESDGCHPGYRELRRVGIDSASREDRDALLRFRAEGMD